MRPKETAAHVFSCKFWKSFKRSFYREYLQETTSVILAVLDCGHSRDDNFFWDGSLNIVISWYSIWDALITEIIWCVFQNFYWKWFTFSNSGISISTHSKRIISSLYFVGADTFHLSSFSCCFFVHFFFFVITFD